MSTRTVISNSIPRRISNNTYNVRVITGGTVEGTRFTGNATLFGYDISPAEYNELIRNPGAERYLIREGTVENQFPLRIFGQTRNNQVVPIDDTNNPIINSLILDSNQNKTQLINAERAALVNAGLSLSPTDTNVDPNAATTPAPGEQPPSQGSSTGGGTRVGPVTRGTGIPVQADITRRYGILTYPADMDSKQDKIKFTVWKHKTRGIPRGVTGERAGQTSISIANNTNLLSSTPGSEMQNYEQIPGNVAVYLPVTKISDTNTVDWGEDSMNTLQRQLAQISLEFMKNNGSGAIDQISQLLNYAKGTEFYDMALLYLAGQAVGVEGLISRGTGAIFNPNLELLFKNPQLRAFTFNFPLISKNFGDAERIKQIINFFKKNMAVRATENNVFLNSPYVFKIEYLTENNEPHQSLNQIKMCALQACNVDYTPMGSYMTFKDTPHTMFMYNLTLQFKELHPIYDVDYGSHPIGY